MEFKLSRNAIMTFMLKNKQSMINQDGFFFIQRLQNTLLRCVRAILSYSKVEQKREWRENKNRERRTQTREFNRVFTRIK